MADDGRAPAGAEGAGGTSRIGAAYRRLLDGCGIVSALLFGAMAVLIMLDVSLRNLRLGNLPWALELSEYILPVATFLAAPWVLYHGGHVRVGILVDALPRPAQRALGLFANLAGLVACLVFIHYGWEVIQDSQAMGSLVIKTLVFPEWWILAPVPLSSLLLAVEFVRRIHADLAGGR